MSHITQLLEVVRAYREYVDALPKDLALPAMPGFDRDWADTIESQARAALAQPAPVETKAQVLASRLTNALIDLATPDGGDVSDIGAQPSEPLPAGLERCEFDDSCDFCDAPEQGVFTRLTHNAEDCTEAEFYICGGCLYKAIPPKARPVAQPEPVEPVTNTEVCAALVTTSNVSKGTPESAWSAESKRFMRLALENFLKSRAAAKGGV